MKKTILVIVLIGISFNVKGQVNDTGDKVGIGTTTPNEKLEVNGNIKVSSNKVISVNRGRIGFSHIVNDWNHAIYNNYNNIDNEGAWDGMKFNVYKGASFRVGSAKINALFINETGNIGIGTSNPSAKLTLNNGSDYEKILQFGADGPTHWFMGIGNNGGDFFHLGDNSNKRLVIRKSSGNIGIGTSNPDMKLTVKGSIHAEEVKIDLNVPAPDYVFKNDYDLKTIQEVEKYIIENGHLPEIPSAKEFEQNGVMLAEMNMNLLKKIEELTLYTIEQQKEIEKLKLLEERLEKIGKLIQAKE